MSCDGCPNELPDDHLVFAREVDGKLHGWRFCSWACFKAFYDHARWLPCPGIVWGRESSCHDER